MQPSRWIRGGLVALHDGLTWTAAHRDIHLRGNRIAELLDPQPAAPTGLDIDASGSLVLPGFINAHMHSNDAFFRGRHEQLPLEQYMLAAGAPWGLDIEPSLRMIEVRTALCAAEAVLTGTTTMLDDCYQTGRLTIDKLNAVEKGFTDVGVRAYVGVDLSDLDMPDTIAGLNGHLGTAQQRDLRGRQQPLTEQLATAREWVAQRPTRAITRMVNASGPQRCSDNLLVEVATIAAQADSLWTTHLAETRAQAVTGHRHYGRSLLQHCADLGIVDRRLLFAHGIWLSEADIADIAERGASIVHNPSSNLRLGSGIASVSRMRSAGVNVALGTDGIASNDSQNMFLECRLAASLQNVVATDRHDWLTAHQALEFATLNGGRALNAPDLGRIAVGAKADLTILHLNGFAHVGGGDPLRKVVYAELGQSVDTVIVDGNVIVRAGRLTTLDVGELMAEADELCRKFFRDNEAAFSRFNDFLPSFDTALDCLRHDGFSSMHSLSAGDIRD